MKASNSGSALLRLRKVSRTYGKRQALLPLDLDVAAGRCTALFGHNGSGKSTLLRIAAGRDAPTSGQALFAGRPMSEDDPEVRARVAVVGDTVACYPDLTVREHLELVTVAHAVDDAATWIDDSSPTAGCPTTPTRCPAPCPPGQMQSLLLAAALVRPRDLLVLDEPEQRLDPDARRPAGGTAGRREGERYGGAARHPPGRPGRGGRRPHGGPGGRPGDRPGLARAAVLRQLGVRRVTAARPVDGPPDPGDPANRGDPGASDTVDDHRRGGGRLRPGARRTTTAPPRRSSGCGPSAAPTAASRAGTWPCWCTPCCWRWSATAAASPCTSCAA